LPKRKVGLALSSGFARGLAHIGVLGVLEKEGIPIDMIAGTSAGALIGALYAQGKDVSQIRHLAISLASKRFGLFADLALPKTGLVRGKKINQVLRSAIGDTTFRDLRIPFACVATDIDTGEEVVINQGSVMEGVRASGSIPVVLAVAKWEGRYLVDGALVNPVPVRVVKEMGADFIIAVNAIPNMSKKLEPADREPNIFKVIMQTIHISGYQAVRSSLMGADVVIEPQLVDVGFGAFHRAEECILRGEMTAQEAIPEIRRRLEARNL